MDELDKIYNKLDSIQQTFGYTGLIIVLCTIAVMVAYWIFFNSYFKYLAKSIFNQKLSHLQAELVEKIGEKLVQQKGDLQREITMLQSNLNLVAGQKTNFLNEKRNSLINLHHALTNNIYTIVHQTLSFEEQDISSFYNANKKMDIADSKFHLAYNTYQIFWQKQELNETIDLLKHEIAMLYIQKYGELTFYNLQIKRKFELEKSLNNTDSRKTDEIQSLQNKKFEVLNQINSFRDEGYPRFKKQYDTVRELQTEASKKISQLLKESFED